MGWEQRGNHSYYYRKERDGSRVKSIYVGRGELARLDALMLKMQQEDQKAERMRRIKELNALSPIDSNIHALSRLVSTLTEAVLIDAGFHQHKRQWRKRRQ